MGGPRTRSAVLLLTLWVEGSPPAFRARARFVPDVLKDERESVVLGSEEEVVRMVRGWVAAFAKGDPDPR